MAANAFAAGLSILPPKEPKPLPSARTHTKAPSAQELDGIALPDYGLTGTGKGKRAGPFESSQCISARTPDQLESSTPSTPDDEDVTGIVPSFHYPATNKWRVIAACFTYLGNGMNDSVPGALIPYIESHYHIGYAVVSLIFVTNAVGFILSAFANDAISSRLGRARSLMLSEAIMIAGCIILSCTPPFPVVVVAYLFLGFGEALNLALNNVFCANLANPTVILGASHGSYGVGGVIAPILATVMVSRGILWSRFFLILLGLRAIILVFTGWASWSYEKEGPTHFANSLEETLGRQHSGVAEPTKLQLLGRALRNRTTIIGALFIFAYQGAEVSESGWFISFLINYRNGDPAKVGYVTAGFWGGITAGRFVLSHLARPVGEKRFVLALGLGCIALQLLAWFVPNVIGNAVTVSILGLLLGPIYPCAQTIFTRLLPGNSQVISIGFISSAGSSGGAVVPFTTGILAQAAGTFVLHPVCIGFFALMLGCWAVLPKVGKRRE